MRFHLKADAQLDADTIDAALLKLSSHFKAVSEGANPSTLTSGKIELKPVDDQCDRCGAPYTPGTGGWGMRANHLLCPPCFKLCRP